ncbi:hypothetical protein PS1_037020 [Malus domestica]
MESGRGHGKRILVKYEEEEEDEEEEEESRSGTPSIVDGEDERRDTVMMMNSTAPPPTGRGSGAGGSTAGPCCKVDCCNADLSDLKQYYRRHKVCDVHAKAPAVFMGGIRQRFCQQCSRFHSLSEFDDRKRSCRRRLAGHNERRRKTSLQ